MHTYKSLPYNVPDIISDIVSELSDNLSSELGMDVQFLHGTWLSIKQRITEENGSRVSKNARFPLICLVQVFEEKFDVNSEYSDVSLTLLICNNSTPEWWSEERYSNNYIPILYPIYAEFMELLNRSRYFVGYAQRVYTHTKADDLHLPEQDANKMPECLDGVWIKDLKLRLDIPKCTPVESWINTITEFGTPSKVGNDKTIPFTVTIDDIDGFKDGSLIYVRGIAELDIPTLVTSGSTNIVRQNSNSAPIGIYKVIDSSLMTKVLSFTLKCTYSEEIDITAKVTNITTLKPNWVNKQNTQDIINY